MPGLRCNNPAGDGGRARGAAGGRAAAGAAGREPRGRVPSGGVAVGGEPPGRVPSGWGPAGGDGRAVTDAAVVGRILREYRLVPASMRRRYGSVSGTRVGYEFREPG